MQSRTNSQAPPYKTMFSLFELKLSVEWENKIDLEYTSFSEKYVGSTKSDFDSSAQY
jgi:hypothetical protein